ncbi:MAG: hypothetical protein NTX50_09740 [Candidatus Sumerlaeota bacterium]|nr:hypothetical protein [Candidatus Sumerlaeota bacterium]
MSDILIIGFRGYGKIQVARELARLLKCRFVDLDDVIVDIDRPRTGRRQSCRDIYQQIGADKFRDLERRAAKYLRDETVPESGDQVIAIGGESWMDENIQEILRPMGKLVYLQGVFTEMWERMERQGVPDHLKSSDGREQFKALLSEREAVCLQHADVVVNISGLDIESAAQSAINALVGMSESKS